MIAFNLTPSSLLSKNGVSLRNPSLSYQRWFYFCLFLLEQFNCRWFPFTTKKGARPFAGRAPLHCVKPDSYAAYFTSGRLAAAADWPTRRVFSSGASGRKATSGYSSSITRLAVSRMISPPRPLITRPIICTWWIS